MKNPFIEMRHVARFQARSVREIVDEHKRGVAA
jgi:hypothetical protein